VLCRMKVLVKNREQLQSAKHVSYILRQPATTATSYRSFVRADRETLSVLRMRPISHLKARYNATDVGDTN